jgi:hypothetical protein
MVIQGNDEMSELTVIINEIARIYEIPYASSEKPMAGCNTSAKETITLSCRQKYDASFNEI